VLKASETALWSVYDLAMLDLDGVVYIGGHFRWYGAVATGRIPGRIIGLRVRRRPGRNAGRAAPGVGGPGWAAHGRVWPCCRVQSASSRRVLCGITRAG